MELGTKEFNDSAMEMFGGKPKQQTAVEWLAFKFSKSSEDELVGNINIWFGQAIQMEKQQMIDFANDLLARNNKNYIALPDLAEEYYNENFKNK